MGRPTTDTNLMNRLAAASVNTQTTLDIVFPDTSQMHVSTAVFTGSNLYSYASDLRRASEIKQSISQSVDRVQVTIQNVDKVFGAIVTAESLIKAVGIVGRQYGPPGTGGRAWAELFRGEIRPLSIDQDLVTLEILNDLVAAGICVSHWSLAENCQFVYKHADTCGFAGAMSSCSKRRKGPGGCIEHIVSGTTSNEYRFGGMENPDPPPPPTAPPGGGGDEGPPGGGGWEPCPRLDQWILVRGMGPEPVAKPVGKLTLRDRVFDPVTGTFHELASLEIIRGEIIMQVTTENLATSFNSASHRIIRNRNDDRGTRCEDMYEGYSVLTWREGRLQDSATEKVAFTGGKGDVMRIKMKSGHIYCSGHTPKAFVVAHNTKIHLY